LKKTSAANTALHNTTPDRVTLGRRLRARRKESGLTLSDVAVRSGVSITTISRAERGQLALSYEKFTAIGRALNWDIGSMFAQAGAKRTVLDGPVVTRAGHGVLYQGQSQAYEFLGTTVGGKQMNPILATIHARRFNGPDDFARHDGEEFVFVLSGVVEVHFENAMTVRLVRGDSLYFDSRVGHAYVSVTRQFARTIGACTSESSQVNVAHANAPIKRTLAKARRS
jgi:transcriptional regulator with XRE-family HTH domain